MATTTESMKNFFETMMDTQKQVLDNMKSTAEKLAQPIRTEARQNWDSNQEFFKNWYEKQTNLFNQMTQNQGNWNPAQNQAQYQEFFNEWMNTQQDLFKNFLETYQKMAGSGMTQMKEFSKMNGMSGDWTSLYKQWTDAMQNTYQSLQSMMPGQSNKEAFGGMFSNMEMFARFSEMWAPVFKAMQENTFKPAMFENLFNQDAWQKMMSNMFNLSPDWMKNMNSNFTDQQKNWMNQSMEMLNGNMKDMSARFQQWNNMPAQFDAFLKMYQDGFSMLEKAAAPMAHLVNPGPAKDQAEAAARIQKLMTTFQVRNAQMMYHIQTTGQKVNEEMMTTWMEKMKEGQFPKTMMEAYTEWLSLSDKLFVKLFESDEYSKLQSELSSTGMKLKKEMDLQMEKSLSHLPLINRTEMDDFYKTVYDLKKRVRDLEREKEAAGDAELNSAPAAPAAKAKTTRTTK